MNKTATHSLRVTQVIRANPERLFRAWTEPEELERWWRMEGGGWAFAGASVDLRVGGHYRLGMTSPEGREHVAVGVYREIQPPARLAFTWDWDEPADRVGETLVTIEFKALGNETTEVILTHERFADAPKAAGHERGWEQLLRLLAHATERASS